MVDYSSLSPTTEQGSEKEQVKEFLSRAEIRTMHKDLQKLREAVALQERERIIGLKPQMAVPPKKETPKAGTIQASQAPEAPQEPAEKTSRSSTLENTKIFQQKKEEEKAGMAEMKDYAQEEEKQRILYLEEQKMDLQKELEILEKQKEPPLLLEKNKATLKRGDLQKKAKVFSDEEKKVEDEEKLISEREKAMTLPSDKEKMEKKRWEIEGRRQESEKKDWAVEKELENAEKELKAADDACEKIAAEINGAKNKIAGIDESLRAVYAGIMNREKARIAKEKEKKDMESLKRAASAGKMKEDVVRQQWAGRKGTSDLSFLSKLPEDAKKQRLQQMMENTAGQEEEERRKFLENVEKWSEERDKNPNPQIPNKN